jgi:hypothetical protein
MLGDVLCHIFEGSGSIIHLTQLELSLTLIYSTQFLDSFQILKSSLQLGRDQLDCNGGERQVERDFFIPIGHMEQRFGNFNGFDANTHLETLLDEDLELSGGHVGTCVSFVRFRVFLAETFEIRLDGAGLNDTEID